MNVKTTLTLVRGTVPSTRSASDGCVLFLLAAAAAMRTFAHTLTHFPLGSFIFELTQALLVLSVRKKEREQEELQLSEGVKDSLKGNAEQVTPATELNFYSRFISPFYLSIFHLALTPTVTIHTHTHTHTTLCLSLSSAGQCL